MSTIDTQVESGYSFSLFFGETTYDCSKSLIAINSELVVHQRIDDSFDEMLEFLESIKEAATHPYGQWHWLKELASGLAEDVSNPSENKTDVQPYHLWLSDKIALLEETKTAPENENNRKQTQKFLTAWFHLVSDYHIDPRR